MKIFNPSPVSLHRAIWIGIPVVIGLNFSVLSASAQTNPPAPPQIERLPQPIPSTLPVQPVPLTPPRATPPNLPTPTTERIKVLRYEVIGSTVFSDRELAKITQPFIGEVTFDRLQAAKNAIEKLYLDRQYLTSGAYIPTGQTLAIDGAVVRIQIVEGKLEDIRVTGTKRLNPEYIRSRLALATSQPLNNDRLIEGLRLLQQDPLIGSIAAELSSGIQPGTNLLEIKVTENPTFTSEIATNNYRPPSIGSWQRRGQISEASLTGWGDRVILAYSNTDGSNGIDVSYTVPLSNSQTTLSANLGGTNSRIIEEPYRSLDITTNSRYAEVSVRQPLLRRAQQDSTQEFALSLTGSKLESTSALGNTPYPLSPGADNNGRIGVSALRFGQEYTYRDSRSVLAFRSQVNVGFGAFNATINNDAPDSRFVSWQGQGRWLKQLARNTDLIIQGRVQLADRSLVALEQFSVGGQTTVRGYRQDALLADNGAFASIELQLPIGNGNNSVFQVAPFIDVGTVWNNTNRANLGGNTLLSTGLGLQWRSDNLSARIDWGIPLVNAAVQKNSWQDNGLYFSLRYFP
ncbi:ShlB/FhaC/HecB family hemolysin secretion/activation protein [Chamaesiphon sp. OTE_20_metabat_361]|uniref:ShlB/FhaC/HecB family hemolysin secretion/activation protein n=1 Tax=Chamaesiphon sp. OTE_20_metabat_361 TaxID=2964689 RepID=UPI00286C115B|nr:ShlB/FhaC/HecB family hemolysin secretion/activation protein [Chamaesiphon sp. OTE_20_metabat_361]